MALWCVFYLCAASADRVQVSSNSSLPPWVLIKAGLEGVTCFRLHWFGNVVSLTQLRVCLWPYVNVT